MPSSWLLGVSHLSRMVEASVGSYVISSGADGTAQENTVDSINCNFNHKEVNFEDLDPGINAAS